MDNYTLEGQLHEAIYAGDLVAVRKLIAHGANPQAADHHGLTALHCAVNANAVVIAGFLIEQGSDINARNEKMDMTPLHLAAFYGIAPIAALLISHGARTDIRDEAGDTALKIARNMGHQQIVALLEQAQTTPHATPALHPAYSIA